MYCMSPVSNDLFNKSCCDKDAPTRNILSSLVDNKPCPIQASAKSEWTNWIRAIASSRANLAAIPLARLQREYDDLDGTAEEGAFYVYCETIYISYLWILRVLVQQQREINGPSKKDHIQKQHPEDGWHETNVNHGSWNEYFPCNQRIEA